LYKAKNATKPRKARVEALEAKAEEAVEDREGKLERVRRELPNARNTDLVDEMNRAVRIQRLVDTGKWAAKHLTHKGQMDMAE
jgi:hypothetical protein